VEETREVEVIASEGRSITGYGSRKKGGRFALPEKLANELIKQQPEAFKAVREKKTADAQEVNDDDN